MAILPATNPGKTLPQAHPGMHEPDGVSGASAADAQPEDFDEADLLAGNAGLGPDEVLEPDGGPVMRYA